MRRVWPADVEQILQENGVVLAGLQKTFAISGVNGSLVACEEASSNPDARGAERQSRSKTAPIGCAACGDHRHRRYSIHHGRYERHCRHRPADMPACLPALRNDNINAAFHGLLGVGYRTNGVQNNCSTRLCSRYKRRWVAPEEGDDGNALVETGSQAFFLWEIQHQVDAERPRGQGTRFSNLRPHGLDVRTPGRQHAESACVAHCRRQRRPDRTTHGSLNNPEFNPEAVAKSCFHPVHSQSRGLQNGEPPSVRLSMSILFRSAHGAFQATRYPTRIGHAKRTFAGHFEFLRSR